MNFLKAYEYSINYDSKYIVPLGMDCEDVVIVNFDREFNND